MQAELFGKLQNRGGMQAFIGNGFGLTGVASRHGRPVARSSHGRRRLVVTAIRNWTPDSEGKVTVASPFGISLRDPMELPPRVLMAAEADEVNEARLSELLAAALETDNSASAVLKALQELRFFPSGKTVDSLLKLLRSTNNELVRSQIIWTLALLCEGQDQCWQTILTELENVDDPFVCSAAAGAVGHIRSKEGISSLVRAYTLSDDFVVKMSAAVSLGCIGDLSTVPQLIRWLGKYDHDKVNADSIVIQSLIGALGDIGDVQGLETLIQWKNNPEALVRQQVAYAVSLLKSDDPKILEVLGELAKDPERVVFQSAQSYIDVYESWLKNRQTSEQTTE